MNPITYFKNKKLLRALRARNFVQASLWIERGADVNLIDKTNGWTPLMYAVTGGDKNAVVRFLNLNADPNVGTFQGETPAMRAMSFRYNDIVRTLLDSPRLAVNQADALGRTMLSQGIHCLNEDGVQCLIADGRVSLTEKEQRQLIGFTHELIRRYPEERRYPQMLKLLEKVCQQSDKRVIANHTVPTHAAVVSERVRQS